LAFALILPLNSLTKQLSIAAVAIAASYPYFKRFFAIPQAYLGIAFGFGIPMAFAAIQNSIPLLAWILLVANIFWAIAYDTEYAMVDKDDDIKIGIRTSAITFGQYDVVAIMLSYAMCFALILYAGWQFGLRSWFLLGMLIACACAIYHYRLIKDRDRMSCFAAFRHNNWLGAAMFAGIALDYALK
jgi:4-hydroxybenzoate polyprenyltransferase